MKYRQQTLVPSYRNMMLSAGKPANTVTVGNALKLYDYAGVDYPVSGDETLKGYGYIGIRQRHINIWNSVELNSILERV